MTERLATIAPDLVTQLTSLPEDEQRRIASALAHEAASRTGLGGEVAGESAEALASRLDEAAWSIQERHEAGQATEHEYLDAFEKARAAWALHYAVEPEPITAVLDTAYETQAALGSLDQLRRVLQSLLP